MEWELYVFLVINSLSCNQNLSWLNEKKKKKCVFSTHEHKQKALILIPAWQKTDLRLKFYRLLYYVKCYCASL